MRKVEIGLVVLAVIGFLFKLMAWPFAGVMLVLGTSTLGYMYFFLSFALLNDIGFRQIFKKGSFKGVGAGKIVASIFVGFALCLATLALLFKLQFWPGAARYTQVSLFWMTILVAIAIVTGFMKKPSFTQSTSARIIILAALILISYLTPSTTLIDIFYRHHPDYAAAYKDYITNPEDSLAQKRYDQEWEKMRGYPKENVKEEEP